MKINLKYSQYCATSLTPANIQILILKAPLIERFRERKEESKEGKKSYL